jgi:hypothetical protein
MELAAAVLALALAELPALKVAVLNTAQWDGVDLAVAGLGDEPLADRLAWLDRYAPPDRDRELHVLAFPVR